MVLRITLRTLVHNLFILLGLQRLLYQPILPSLEREVVKFQQNKQIIISFPDRINKHSYTEAAPTTLTKKCIHHPNKQGDHERQRKRW